MGKRNGLKEFNSAYKFKSKWPEAFADKDFIDTFSTEILENYIPKKRWYAGKASTLKYIEIIDHFKLTSKENNYFGILLEVNFQEAFFQNYFMPISFMSEEKLDTNTIIAPAIFGRQEGYLVDAIHIEEFRKLLFTLIATSKNLSEGLKVKFHKEEALDKISYKSSRFMGAEQSNTSVIYNEKYVMKFFRRIFMSTNPDYELSRFLTENRKFKNTPSYVGSINVSYGEDETITIGLMQELISNQGDAWVLFLGLLDKIFSSMKSKKIKISNIHDIEHFKKIKIEDIPAEIKNWAGVDIFSKVKKMAERTAEMHLALGNDIHNTEFIPATYNGDYSVWLKNRLIHQFQNRLNAVENNMHKLDGEALELAKEFLDRKKEIRNHFLDFDWTKLKSERIRIHGDFHLGQILVQDDDFYILDFEGEPECTIRDRKVKQTPLKDVAGLFRSFHYAIYSNIFKHSEKYGIAQADLFHSGDILYNYLVNVFLEVYVNKIQSENLNIGYEQEINFLLKYCLLEKAVYELGYELNSRPLMAIVPLKGIVSILNDYY